MSDLHSVPAPAESRPRGNGKLERGGIRIALIQQLAIGTSNQRELADLFDVSQPAIHYFAERHRAEIEALRETTMERTLAMGLWIADKFARVGEYQSDAEAVNGWHETVTEDGPVPLDAALLRAKHAAMRAVAEELGQLRTVVDETVTVRYELVGVDPEALR